LAGKAAYSESDELIGEEFPDAVVVSDKGMLAIVSLEGHAVGADMQIAGTVAHKEAIVVMKDPEHGTSPRLMASRRQYSAAPN
jgi:hypothetical protein